MLKKIKKTKTTGRNQTKPRQREPTPRHAKRTSKPPTKPPTKSNRADRTATKRSADTQRRPAPRKESRARAAHAGRSGRTSRTRQRSRRPTPRKRPRGREMPTRERSENQGQRYEKKRHQARKKRKKKARPREDTENAPPKTKIPWVFLRSPQERREPVRAVGGTPAAFWVEMQGRQGNGRDESAIDRQPHGTAARCWIMALGCRVQRTDGTAEARGHENRAEMEKTEPTPRQSITHPRLRAHKL